MGARGAETRTRAAQAMFDKTADPATNRRVRDLALGALRKDPTALLGWTIVAMLRAADGDLDGADRILSGLGNLAQRDLPTQLWLIDQRVRQGDIRGALRHYDIALRTSDSSDDLLLPILVQATGEPLVARHLPPLLQARPNWERPFLVLLAEAAPNDAVLSQMLVRTYGTDEAGMSDALMNIARRMAAQDAAPSAWRVYRAVAPDAARSLLRNGSFEASPQWPPFDWEFANEGQVTAAISSNPQDEGEKALDIRASSDGRGEAARQSLALAPGSYRIVATAGTAEGENPAGVVLRMVCTGPAGRELLNRELPPTGRRSSAALAVPAAGCAHQLLLIDASAGAMAGSAAAWVDQIAIASGQAGASAAH